MVGNKSGLSLHEQEVALEVHVRGQLEVLDFDSASAWNRCIPVIFAVMKDSKSRLRMNELRILSVSCDIWQLRDIITDATRIVGKNLECFIWNTLRRSALT
jgi:hypothetical protein